MLIIALLTHRLAIWCTLCWFWKTLCAMQWQTLASPPHGIVLPPSIILMQSGWPLWACFHSYYVHTMCMLGSWSFPSAPVLEGITTVPLVAGKANFTKLRVNVPANGLTLSFVVQNFEVTTSVKFSVVSPPASTARRHVSFILTGDTSQISQLLSTVNVTIAFALCNQMNIDISRLLDVSVTVGIYKPCIWCCKIVPSLVYLSLYSIM